MRPRGGADSSVRGRSRCDPYPRGVDFYSAYAHGFARVAACTLPVTVADPAANAARSSRMAKEAHEDGVAVAVFPELCLTGYADRRPLAAGHAAGRDARRDRRGGRRVRGPAAGAGRRRAAGPRHPGAQLRGGRPPRADPRGARRSRYLPTYREFYERRYFAPGDDRRGTTIRVGDRRVPFGPDLIFRATDVPGPRRCTSRSARTCGCRSRRAPRPRWPVRRCWPTSRAARSRSRGPRTGGCWSGRRRRAATRRTSSRPRARASRRPT